MINIRTRLFETNSSSVHTLVFHKTDPLKIICDDPMEIYGGSYGRCPQAPLDSLYERLNYLWTAIWDYCISYNYIRETGQWEININKKELQWWKDEIHTYCPNAILHHIDPESWYGIDHTDLMSNLLEAMKQDSSILKDFLLDSNATIYIDGDEYESSFDYDEIPKVNIWDGEEYETLLPLSDQTGYFYVKGN